MEDFTRRGLDDLLENRIIRTPMPASETFRDGKPEHASYEPCPGQYVALTALHDIFSQGVELKQLCWLCSSAAMYADVALPNVTTPVQHQGHQAYTAVCLAKQRHAVMERLRCGGVDFSLTCRA